MKRPLPNIYRGKFSVLSRKQFIYQFQIQCNQQIPRFLKVILTLQSYGQKGCFNDNILRLTNQLQLISHLIVMKS